MEMVAVANCKNNHGLHRQNTLPNIQNCVREFQPLLIIDSRVRKTKFFPPTNVSKDFSILRYRVSKHKLLFLF